MINIFTENQASAANFFLDLCVYLFCETFWQKDILTLYHKIPIFNNPNDNGFRKHFKKRRKCWLPVFPPPKVFSTLSKREIIIVATFNLSSANAFNLVTSAFFSFGKELNAIFLIKKVHLYFLLGFGMDIQFTEQRYLTETTYTDRDGELE